MHFLIIKLFQWELFHVFRKFGIVHNVKIPMNQVSGHGKYGFVVMVNLNGADNVRNELKNGRLKVNEKVTLLVSNVRCGGEQNTPRVAEKSPLSNSNNCNRQAVIQMQFVNKTFIQVKISFSNLLDLIPCNTILTSLFTRVSFYNLKYNMETNKLGVYLVVHQSLCINCGRYKLLCSHIGLLEYFIKKICLQVTGCSRVRYTNRDRPIRLLEGTTRRLDRMIACVYRNLLFYFEIKVFGFLLLHVHSFSGSPSFVSGSPDGASHMDCSMEYLADLVKEKKQLEMFPQAFQHVDRLLEDEISRVRVALFQTDFVTDDVDLPEPIGEVVTITEKVYVPKREFPDTIIFSYIFSITSLIKRLILVVVMFLDFIQNF
uniref:STAR_dimer domain-containing protein n=1 Tax=Heterorhabditis bacteriophora TaxID=37862 RepID=A0A1I7X7D3_HETBA